MKLHSEVNGNGYWFVRYSDEGAIRLLRRQRRIQSSEITIKAREPNKYMGCAVGIIVLTVLTIVLSPKDCVALISLGELATIV